MRRREPWGITRIHGVTRLIGKHVYRHKSRGALMRTEARWKLLGYALRGTVECTEVRDGLPETKFSV